MSNSYFNQDYIDFFTELAFHNEKSWFDTNRKRYEQYVKEPFKAFVIDVIAGIQKFDSAIGPLEPKLVTFRINRDVRFAKDKTPYNTWLSAGIVPGGKKYSDQRAGYYFRFAVDKVSVGGGMFGPNREKLHSIRSTIAGNPLALHKIIDAQEFKQTWGDLQGNENKILPKEFKATANTEPLIKKKDFTYWQEHPETEILRVDLLEWILELFKTGHALNVYLDSAS